MPFKFGPRARQKISNHGFINAAELICLYKDINVRDGNQTNARGGTTKWLIIDRVTAASCNVKLIVKCALALANAQVLITTCTL